jgi:hypothetical protein
VLTSSFRFVDHLLLSCWLGFWCHGLVCVCVFLVLVLVLVWERNSRPGILVLINDTDWELEGEGEYALKDGDEVVFISTLHGG